MAAPSPGTVRFKEVSSTPSTPPAGYCSIYAKTDNVLYLLDSSGVEVALGSASSITQLIGDVLATGPGVTTATVAFVGGKSAAAIATSVDDTQTATSVNTFSTIVKRDSSGDIFVTHVNGVVVEAHASRHLPSGSDPITTAAPLVNLSATTTNAIGTANSLARSDHSHAISTGAASSQTPDQANATGSSANIARADHIHNIPTDVPIQANADGNNIQGTAPTFSRSDHKHDILVATPSSQTPNQANAPGVSSSLARADHIHNIPTAAPVTQNADQSNADGVAATFSRSDHIHNIPSGVPVQIGTSNVQGAATTFALSDHVHNHGNQTNGSLHAAATTSVNGFMSAADKLKLDTNVPTTLGTSNQILGVNNAATAAEYKTLSGTTNQITITDGIGSKTFSTPQDIATSSTPTFAGENLTNRLELTEQVAPSTPGSTKIDIFAEASNGFTRLRVLDSTGIKNTILRDSILLVKNVTGSTISAGKGVYYTGADAGTNLPTIALAKADSSLAVPCIGITIESIANNGVGRVMGMGIATNIDTSAFAQGDKLYLSPTTAGNFTATKPVSPNIWQRIGIVLISNASTGAIEVKPFATHGEESGTNTAFTLNTVTLTDAANIATNATLGNIFKVTLGGNRNLSAPTNPTDGQKITYRITQDATGGRGLTFDTVFNFGLDIISFVPSTGANKIDYIGCIYNGATSKWDVVAVSKGFS